MVVLTLYYKSSIYSSVSRIEFFITERRSQFQRQ